MEPRVPRDRLVRESPPPYNTFLSPQAIELMYPEQSGATPSAPSEQGVGLISYQDNNFGGGFEGQPPQRPPRAGEQAPLLITQGQQAHHHTNRVNPPVEKFSFEKFVLLWLGIGRSYTNLCFVLFVLITMWGLGIIGLTVYSIVVPSHNIPMNFKDTLYLIYSLCLASGVTFVLIGICWPVTYCWNKIQTNRNFTLLCCYTYFLLMLIACCAVGIGIELYEKHDLFISVTTNLQLNEQLPPFLALGGLVVTFVVFVCISCFCVCCCKRHIGRVY